MNILYNAINRINYLINDVPQKLENFSNEELSHKPAPGKWSKKEILGHLCDSAINNLSRFIRALFEPEPVKMTGYMQDEWVEANHYQDIDSNEIVNYWVSLNIRINYVISKIPQDKLSVQCELSDITFRTLGDDKSLLWLIEDYVVHMEYHLKQLGIMN